jgi:mono/diheme cytochrome c family protein
MLIRSSWLRTLSAAAVMATVLSCPCPVGAAPEGELTAEETEFFEKRIRPIFVTHCYECHSGEKQKKEGGLTVDSRAALLKGGDSGPAIVTGDPDKSLLLIAVRQTDKDLKMPPEGKLTAAQLDDLAAWIKRGAPDPRKTVVTMDLTTARPKTGMTLEEGRRFWSFQPLRDPPIVR